MADLTRKTANLLNIADCNFTINSTLSVTFAKGTISFNGSSGYISSSNAAWKTNFAFYLDAGTYSMNIPSQLGAGYARYIKQYSDDTTLLGASATSFTLAERTQVYFAFYIDGKTLNDTMNFMLVEGSTVQDFEPYGWVHSLRKLCSATETIQSGDTIYTNGQPITTYTLKGNEEHTGTPTPSNPVTVQGTGDKTANLLSGWTKGQRLDPSNGAVRTDTAEACLSDFIPFDTTKSYIVNPLYSNYNSFAAAFNANKQFLGRTSATVRASIGFDASSFTGGTPQGTGDIAFVRITIYNTGSQTGNIDDAIAMETMMNEGSIVLPYEPYGYKIPISNGRQTTNIYLGSTQTVREISKRIFDGTENWHLHGSLANLFYIDDYQDGYADNFNSDFAISNAFVQKSYTVVAGLSNGQFVYGTPAGTTTKRILMKNTACATETDWKTWLADQYAAGTPVTVWYVLATPETAAANEPLMKIGAYADSISNAAAIPTIEGANAISIDTTVQPSEFTATWTGWHNASAKEWDGTNWN